MNEEIFWEVILQLDWTKAGDDDAVLEPAIKRLVSLIVDDIYQFAEILAEKLFLLDGLSFASNIGENSYKGEGNDFSVDYFLYVRCCVVANGKDFYNEVIADLEKMPKDMDFEALLYLPEEAYSGKTQSDDYDYETKYSFETFSNIKKWPIYT